jgi:hypothetical protein
MYFSVLIYCRHILATLIDAQACEDAAYWLCFIAFQKMPVHVQSGFDIFMPHKCLYRLKVFPVGDENGRIEIPDYALSSAIGSMIRNRNIRLFLRI